MRGVVGGLGRGYLQGIATVRVHDVGNITCWVGSVVYLPIYSDALDILFSYILYDIG